MRKGEKNKRSLVIFDFDGTMTKKDTLIEFTKFYVGKKTFYIKFLLILPILLFYKTKLISNTKAKEIFFKHFFKNEDKDKFLAKAKEFSLNKLDKLLDERIYKKFLEYKQRNFEIYIVSASIECYLKPWCERENVRLISTNLLFENNKFTGKFATPNCYGIEKLNRFLQEVDILKYNEIHCYADDKSDKFIMSIATHKFWVNLRTRCSP